MDEDPNQEIEVSAKADSLTVKAKGRAAGRLADQLADIISPFSGVLGAAGDRVQEYRIFRREAAAAALLRARQIREEHGVLSHRVSPKLLAPWLEGASSEDLGGENIVELWARILATAGEGFDARTLRYVDIAKSIGPKEASFFQTMMENYKKTQIPDAFLNKVGLDSPNANYAASENQTAIYRLINDLFTESGNSITRDQLVCEIEGLNTKIVGHVDSFVVGRKRNGPSGSDKPEFELIQWETPNREQVEVLKLVGLLTEVTNGQTKADSGRMVSFTYLNPTRLGCALYFEVLHKSGVH